MVFNNVLQCIDDPNLDCIKEGKRGYVNAGRKIDDSAPAGPKIIRHTQESGSLARQRYEAARQHTRARYHHAGEKARESARPPVIRIRRR
jgi:hypothetical protein